MSVMLPQENPYLTGHQQAEASFSLAFSEGRLAGSWLISGSRGIGKATLAYRLARYVLASDLAGNGMFADAPTDFSMSEDHPIFNRMKQGTLGDLMVVELDVEEGKSEIGVDEVRKIGKFLSQTPSESDWRVVIVDSVDDLNRNAANALLKVLEEPPRNTLMLLVSHCPGRLLPTIRSRCRQVALRPLADDMVRDMLKQNSGGVLEDELGDFAACLAGGSPGLATELYDHDVVELYSRCVGIFATAPELNIVSVQQLGEELAGKDAQQQWRLAHYLIDWFLSKTIQSHVTGEEITEFVSGERNASERLLAYYSVDQLINLWENLASIVAQTDGLNMDKKLATQQVFAELMTA